MTIELINTGSELLLGFVLNTHQQWICRQLTDLGHTVSRQVAVPDGGHDIQQAVRQALGRADLVITTGGLGPTCDDITRELIAQLLGRRLLHDEGALQNIARFFANRGRPMPERTKVEAMVPEGATVLTNAHGTAPGLALEVNPNPFRADGKPSLLVMLPGPPRELRPMFSQQVVPLLAQHFPQNEAFVCRTLKTTGIGESFMEERIGTPLKHLTDAGMDLGFCARVGEVDVRFVARGPQAAALVAEAEAITRSLAGEFIFGEQDDALESVLVRELTLRKQTLALAESCTGGHIANRITNIPGASAVLQAGFVTYANEAKTAALGVRSETLAAHGAVSEPVAREMAEGARRVTGADFALSITGIAGPGGGSDEKPVGTVFIALASAKGTSVARQLNRFDRETFKYLTAQQAMMMLWQELKRTDQE
ncbi:MAG TPA: competence/damage-inducible protein A [Candidatus Limnocylindria bacterium]|nr:competence/damage-inducible protein A [Candidatus Limnocylindria bacterium]